MESRSYRAIFGSIFDIKEASVLVCPVNCVGVMGKGLAKQFSEVFPRLVRPYQNACEKGILRPRKPILVPMGGIRPFGSKYVCLFPTKDHWRNPSKIEWIEDGLAWCADQEVNKYAYGAKKAIWAFPLLGAGLGGLPTKRVLEAMKVGFEHFIDEPVVSIPYDQVEEVRRIGFEAEMEARIGNISVETTGETEEPS